MGLLDKVKNMFIEEVEDDEIKKEVIQVKIPTPEKKEDNLNDNNNNNENIFQNVINSNNIIQNDEQQQNLQKINEYTSSIINFRLKTHLSNLILILQKKLRKKKPVQIKSGKQGNCRVFQLYCISICEESVFC